MRRRHMVALATTVVALGGSALAASADSSEVTAAVTSTTELTDGDQVAVELSGVRDTAPIYLTQCVLHDGLPEGIACGRPGSVQPSSSGEASLRLTVRSQVGSAPGAVCPPSDSGRCVLRITQGGIASQQATRVIVPAQGGSLQVDDPPPPDGQRLVQDIGVTLRDDQDPSPTTSAPGSPPTSTPQVGGVTVPPPSFPTTPVDAPRGGRSTGSPARPPSEVAGAVVGRDSIPETGTARTAALAAIGLGLVAIGWVPASAWRRARLAAAATAPVK